MNMNFIVDFVKKLSKRERLVFYGAVLFCSLALFDNMLVKPLIDKFRMYNQDIAAKEAEIKRSLKILAQKDRIEKEMKKYEKLLVGMATEEQGMTSLLKEVEGMANRSSVYLIDIKPSGIKELGIAKKFQVNINYEAQMEQVVEFMHGIESSTKFLTIESFQIGPKSKDSSIARCNMIISKLIIPQNEF